MFNILMAFKFIKLSGAGKSVETVRTASDQDLHELGVVQQAFGDAEQQVLRYIPDIRKRYGNSIRLRCFAVVALGFERLLWQRVGR